MVLCAGVVCLAANALGGCALQVTGGSDAAPSTDGDLDGDAAQSDAAAAGDAAVDAASADAGPPFTCTQEPTSSPVLDAVIALDPADPHPGDTVTVVVRSQGVDRPDAPPMELEVTSASGTVPWQTNAMAGGRAVYYYALSNVEPGDHCVLGRIGGAPEISARFTVTQRPVGPARCGGGIFKVIENHQWTCSEQPEWGNEVFIHVLDANGQGMANQPLRLDWPATTLRPIYNDTAPPAPSDIPPTVVTDGSGVFHGWNYWPINGNGYMVFNVSVDGCASDVATELTTGWWETDNGGCRFCDPSFLHRNVWGHWSYTVTFQLSVAATEACVVSGDHAGQQSCTVEHIHHDPGHDACFPAP
ncbi:MAG: hypothetical protein ABI333_04530 [bacterium]